MPVRDTGRAALRIERVGDGATLSDFLSVPEKVFSDDPNWAPSLRFERKMHLDPKHNPLFGFCEVSLWVAYRDGEPVGRISAQVNRLHLETHNDETGHFGFLDAVEDQDVFETLLATAADWLRGKGMKRVTGPFSLSINEESGLLVDGFDTPPNFMMGHARPYYGSMVEAAGFNKAMDLLAYRFKVGTDPLPPAARKLVEKLQRNPAIRFRTMNKKNMADDLKLVIDIFNDGWSDNWGFIPFTEAEVAQMAKDLKPLVKEDYLHIIERDGEAVAFAMMMPNLNEVFREIGGRLLPFGWLHLARRILFGGFRTGRMPLMGVVKKYQATLVGASYAYATIDLIERTGRKYGFEEGELSWVLETNKNTRTIIEPLTGPAYKTYRIYEKALA